MARWRTATVWLAMWAVDGFLNRLLGTVFTVFLFTRITSDPLKLVLMGTILEGTYLLFEVPTGVLADARSRKVSVVIGFLGTGIAFVILGLAESFAMAAFSQVVYGISATFISGADVAWLTDEVGEEAARPLYLRSEQTYNVGSLVGIVASVTLASFSLPLPLVLSGVGYLVLGVALAFVMVETRRPSREPGTRLRHAARETFRDAVRDVRAHHVLLLILAAAAVHGASTEGWDRLSDVQFLDTIGLPSIGGLDRVVWFGIFDGVSLVLGIVGIAFLKRRRSLEGHVNVARILLVLDLFLVVNILVFAMTGRFWLAVATMWIVGGLRSVREPIFTAWINQGLDRATRATVNSMGSLADAVGQALAGPVVGGVGRVASVPWALSVTGLLGLPVVLLYLRAIRRGTVGTRPPEAIDQELDLEDKAD